MGAAEHGAADICALLAREPGSGVGAADAIRLAACERGALGGLVALDARLGA